MSAFSLKALKLDSLPTSASDSRYQPFVDDLTGASLELVASLPSQGWTQRKTYNTPEHPTVTYQNLSPPGPAPLPDGFKWHARVSEHEGLYENWWDGLGVEHSRKEAEYIESCKVAEKLQVIEEGVLEVWRTAYHLPFPTSNRDFTFLILTIQLPTSSVPSIEPQTASPAPTVSAEVPLRSFLVVSVPVDAPEQKGWTRARYVSVEKVDEVPGGRIKWTMATASDVGGMIPKGIAEAAMPGKISEDVPSFLEWLKKQRKG